MNSGVLCLRVNAVWTAKERSFAASQIPKTCSCASWNECKCGRYTRCSAGGGAFEDTSVREPAAFFFSKLPFISWSDPDVPQRQQTSSGLRDAALIPAALMDVLSMSSCVSYLDTINPQITDVCEPSGVKDEECFCSPMNL